MLNRLSHTLTLAAFLTASLLGQGNSGNTPGASHSNAGGNGNSNAGGNGNGNAGAPNSSAGTGVSNTKPGIQWLTDNATIADELLNDGVSHIDFQSSTDLENVTVWLTPSLAGVTADPIEFPTITKDTLYSIELLLDEPPAHTLGGTLHLRSSDGRTLAKPLPINIKVKGEEDTSTPPPATVTTVVSAANYRGGSVTPGQTVSLFGSGLGPATAQGAQFNTQGRVADYLGDTQVLFNGLPAPLLASSNGQVNAIVPQGIAADTSATIVLTFKNNVAEPITLPVTPAQPALFALDGSGKGQGAVLNQNGTVNSASNPAPRGSVIVLFGTGFGATGSPDGSITTSASPLATPVTVTIGGAAAKVLYAGGAPGLVSGVVQINAEIPATIPAGDKVTIVVSVGNSSSPADVTVAVQ